MNIHSKRFTSTQHGFTQASETSLCLELQKGEFCYVKTSQSRGVLPLCHRICRAMEQRGYRSIVVDLSAVGSNTRLWNVWDYALISSIWESFHPDAMDTLLQWFQSTKMLKPKERLMKFADDYLLLDLCEGPVVICLDSMDALQAVPFAISDVLAWILYCYDLRDSYLTYRHLSFSAFSTTGFSSL